MELESWRDQGSWWGPTALEWPCWDLNLGRLALKPKSCTTSLCCLSKQLFSKVSEDLLWPCSCATGREKEQIRHIPAHKEAWWGNLHQTPLFWKPFLPSLSTTGLLQNQFPYGKNRFSRVGGLRESSPISPLGDENLYCRASAPSTCTCISVHAR